MKAIIGYGSTIPGKTAWKSYGRPPGALVVDVDTSEAGFTSTPKYMTSLGGDSMHWNAVGISSIYKPTPQGFRIYIKSADDAGKAQFVPTKANQKKWHVNWIAIGSVEQE